MTATSKYQAIAQRLVDNLLDRCDFDEEWNKVTYQSIDVKNIAAAIEAAVAAERERCAVIAETFNPAYAMLGDMIAAAIREPNRR